MQKKVLAAAIAGAMCAPIAAEAVSVKVSGHVNRAIRFTDYGAGSDVQHVDHGGSRTRLRWRGSEKIGGGNTAGVYIEIGMASNRAFSIAPKASDGGDSFSGTSSDIRHSALWFGGSWGTLWLGHTGTATYLMSARNLSGMGAIMPNGSNLMNAGTPVVSASGTANTTVSAVSNTLDTGREDVLKYVSPWLGPVQVQVSTSNNDTYGIQAYAKASFGGGNFEGSIGYESGENRNGYDAMGGSASFKFSQGTSITAAYQQHDRVGANSDREFWSFMLGHAWGNNSVAVQYYTADDMVVNGDETTEWALGFRHTIPKARIQLYATYHNTDYERPGQSYSDVDLFMLGSRIFF